LKKSVKPLVKKCVVFALSAIGLWLAWNYYFPKSTLHYRLDVTFQADGVPVTGSSVQKLVVYRVRGLGQRQAEWWTYGEAVRVDLPGHGAVYVLMTTPTPDGTYTFSTKGRFDFLVSWACKLKEQRGDRSWDDFVRMVGALTGECDVPKQYVPLMVRFRDENDPTTVERVFPSQLGNSFDDDVHFVGAEVKITDRPITKSINYYLNWLTEENEKRLTPNYSGSEYPTLSDTLKQSYFRRVER
jgi:hypothetical protein